MFVLLRCLLFHIARAHRALRLRDARASALPAPLDISNRSRRAAQRRARRCLSARAVAEVEAKSMPP